MRHTRRVRLRNVQIGLLVAAISAPVTGICCLALLLTTAGVAKAAPAQDSFQEQFIGEWKALARENRLELIAVLPNYPPLDLPPTLATQGGAWTDRADYLAIKWRVSWRVSHGHLLLGPQYSDSHKLTPHPRAAFPRHRGADCHPSLCTNWRLSLIHI